MWQDTNVLKHLAASTHSYTLYPISKSTSYLHLLHPEDGGIKVLRNVGTLPRRPRLESSSPWKPRDSRMNGTVLTKCRVRTRWTTLELPYFLQFFQYTEIEYGHVSPSRSFFTAYYHRSVSYSTPYKRHKAFDVATVPRDLWWAGKWNVRC
jgi:hypothetical protein